MAQKPIVLKNVPNKLGLLNGMWSQINVVIITFLFFFTENVAEENLFYIVSPKDLVLAKVHLHDTHR